MAKNDQDKGRSLEDQLASLDALSTEQDEPPATPEQPAAAEQSSQEQPADVDSPVPPNPWLHEPSPERDETSAPQVQTPSPAPDFGAAPPPFSPQGFASYGPPSPGPYGPQQPAPPPPSLPSPPQSTPAGDAQATQEVHWPDAQDSVAQQEPPYMDEAQVPPMPPADEQPTEYLTPPPPYGGPTPYGGGPQPYAGPQGFGNPQPYAGPPAYGQAQPYPEPPQAYRQPQPYSGPPLYPGPSTGNVAVPQGPPLAPLPPATAPPPPPSQPSSASLSSENLLRGRKEAPAGGWRKAVYKATAGVVHPGEAPGELRRRELITRARTPVAGGHHRVAVMSLKGGVGKTTTTVGLGATLASLRGDRVIAVDANPDRGTLSDKIKLETRATVRDLLNERNQIQRYADVRAFTSQAPSRIEVLASDQDPAVSEAFSEADYRAVAEVLEHFYSICLTDCGTGLLHSAMAGVLSLANQLVLVSSPSVDGARSASATLDWLEAHDYGDLVRNGVVVLSMVRSRSKSSVDLDRLQEHFEARCQAVVRIPYDTHLEEGAELELNQLAAATRDGYLQLAATVGDGFAWPH